MDRFFREVYNLLRDIPSDLGYKLHLSRDYYFAVVSFLYVVYPGRGLKVKVKLLQIQIYVGLSTSGENELKYLVPQLDRSYCGWEEALNDVALKVRSDVR